MSSDMFMKIDDIKGESVDASHKDEIEVLSWSWSATQSGSAHSGTGGGSGKVSVKDLSFTKYADKSSPMLFKLCCNGKHFQSAQLTIRKAGGSKPVEYIKIKLKDGLVSSVTHGGTPADDRNGHARAWRNSHVEEGRDRETSFGDRRSRQHGCALQR